MTQLNPGGSFIPQPYAELLNCVYNRARIELLDSFELGESTKLILWGLQKVGTYSTHLTRTRNTPVLNSRNAPVLVSPAYRKHFSGPQKVGIINNRGIGWLKEAG